MIRPSSTPDKIEEKLSSVSTIEADSFVTYVPLIPIAIPIFAFFSTDVSLTPSPVIAQTCSFTPLKNSD